MDRCLDRLDNENVDESKVCKIFDSIFHWIIGQIIGAPGLLRFLTALYNNSAIFKYESDARMSL